MATIDRLMSKINVTEFIRCLNPVLAVAEGKKAKEAKQFTAQLELRYAAEPGFPRSAELA